MLEAVVDPFEPPMPGKITADQALKFAESLIRGEPNRKKIALTASSDKVRELVWAAARRRTMKAKRWVADVKTVSTFQPKGLFTKSAATIARSLASKRVSPKGPGSGMRMLT